MKNHKVVLKKYLKNTLVQKLDATAFDDVYT